jgi:uncharacterized membrane protein
VLRYRQASIAVVVLRDVRSAVEAAAPRLIATIPRRAMQLFVGALLSAFGTFWAAAGVGVAWPGGDAALL